MNRYGVPIICIALLLAGFLVGRAQGQQSVVEAQAFVLRDAHGKVQGRFAASDDGPSFLLYNNQGAEVVVLKASSEKTKIMLYDRLGSKPAIELSVPQERQDEPRIALFHDGACRAQLVLWAGGKPSLTLHDDLGRLRASVSLDDKDQPSVSLHDKNQKTIWHAP